MDRLARLRTRSSAGGPLNASTTSSLAAGYETANDESLTSGSGSMYFSMTEGGDKTKGEEEEPDIGAEEEPTLSGTLAVSGHSGVDQTLENDFSVEEVSTIRKATIAHASPATVQVAAGMAVKYLGVSSTPAPKTPKAAAKQEDLSGFDQLDQTPSIMKKMRDPKTPAEMASFAEDPEESKVTLDGSGIQGPVPSNKSYGTNVLANFFASLDVNSGTPAPPEIKISAPEEVPTAPTSGPTPSKRDSNSLENFFESLKKNPQPEAPTNKRRSLVRKSLIPKVGSIVAAAAKQNRVASPISRRSTTVRLIPDKLREMRKTNKQSDQLVQFRRKSTVVPAAAAAIPEATKVATTTTARPAAQRKSMAVAAVRAVTATTTAITNPALKRKLVVPTAASATAVNGRRSVLPAVSAVRRGVVTAAVNPPRVALKIPAKTTLSNGPEGPTTNSNGSTSTRRTLLGKRPATTITTTATSVTVTSSLPDKLPTGSTTTATEQPAAKQRKSLAPVKESSPAIRVSPRNKPSTAPAVHLQSRIRPPTGIPGAGFKKPETFTCDQCQRIFRLKSSFETHLKTVHQPAGTAATSTSTNSSLNKSSDGSATSGAAAGAKCQYCGKAFAGAKFLTNHIVSNCVKIPLLEKRRLLAEGERERAANLKRTPDAAKKSSRMSLRPPTGSGGNASNRSASSTRSGDETDTSTCSSNGGGGGGSATGSGGRKRAVTATTGTGSGASGISRTPNKELKCHLCARRFLNAVEYALHVQAHAKNLKGGGGDAPGGGEEDVENVGQGKEQEEKGKQMTEDVAKLVQKLVTIKNRNGIGAGKVALKSSNSGNVSK